MANSIVFTGDRPTSTIVDQVRNGKLARIAPGVYTEIVDDLISVVAREWPIIVGRLMPDAVITDRSARCI